ncbi:regulatory protein RecX [Chloroflexota bacterium]
MKKITALTQGKRRDKRVNVFLDGKFTFSLNASVATTEALKVGHELTARQEEALVKSDQFQRCFDAAMRYLGYRPHSEAELSGKLRQRNFDDGNITEVIARLKVLGLVDDAAFTKFWKDKRQTFSPRSQWLTKSELRRKGVATEIIDDAADTIDDNDSAYRAAMTRVGRLPLSDYQAFRRRLGDFLRRRGFSYGVINQTIARIWQEHGGSTDKLLLKIISSE